MTDVMLPVEIVLQNVNGTNTIIAEDVQQHADNFSLHIYFKRIHHKNQFIKTMRQQKLNLFITDNNKLTAVILKNHLYARFGENLDITTFCDVQHCIEHLSDQTHILIFDYELENKKELGLLRSSKTINPDTEVIILANEEDVMPSVEPFHRNTNNYILKNNSDESLKDPINSK
jgi:hypothetical protein